MKESNLSLSRSSFLIIVLSIMSIHLCAQNTFSKTYENICDKTKYHKAYNVITWNDNIITFNESVYNIDGQKYFVGSSTLYNSDGEIIKHACHENIFFHELDKVVFNIDSSRLLVPSLLNDDTLGIHSALISFDSELKIDTMYKINFDTQYGQNFNSIKETANYYFYYGNEQNRITQEINLIITKLNKSNLEIVDQNSIPQYGELFYKIEFGDSTFVVITKKRSSDTTRIRQFDFDFNLIKDKIITTGVVNNETYAYTHDRYIYYMTFPMRNMYEYDKQEIHRYDLQEQKVDRKMKIPYDDWFSILGADYVGNIVEENGDIVFYGSTFQELEGKFEKDELSTVGTLLKISDEAELVWLRYYREDKCCDDLLRRSYSFNDIYKSNNNYYIGGSNYYIASTPRRLWLLKIDSLGNLDGEEQNEKIVVIDNENISTNVIVNPDKIWHVLVEKDDQRYTERYTFSSTDTIISEMKYKELLYTREESGNINQSTGRFFREYYSEIYEYKFSDEILIYDMKQSRDSPPWKVTREDGSTITYNIALIWEIMLIDDHETVAYEIKDLRTPPGECETRLIHGIGSEVGFMYDKFFCLDTNITTTLLCFHYNGELFYQHENYDECYITTKLEESSIHNIKITPNPTTSSIRLEYQSQITRVELYNIHGVFLKELEQGKENFLNYASGIYYVKTIGKNNQSITQKLIIQ